MIDTDVPPASRPADGVTLVTLGPVVKVNLSPAEVAEVPPAEVTVMSTVPADSAGLVAVIWVDELMASPLAPTAPKVTAVADDRLVPVMTTLVPPPSGPATGVTEVTTGRAV
jgi:hypothetical protein